LTSTTETSITDKSYRVLEILAAGRELSQREVAQQSGLSLGMVNLILKRLITTGYIKASNLNQKKIEYILTPKGLAEKMARSYAYFVRAYRAFQESQSRVETLLNPLLKKGHRKFVIVGDGEIAKLVEMILKTHAIDGVTVRLASPDKSWGKDELVLDCRLGQTEGQIGISVLEEILDASRLTSVSTSPELSTAKN
jgi:DNA-binding MarR family transcriptional regulator